MSAFEVICKKCGSTNVKVTYQVMRNGEARGRGSCRACRTTDNLSQNLTPREYVMPFGKHQGKTLGVILAEDRDYLLWLSSQAGVRPHLATKILDVLEAL